MLKNNLDFYFYSFFSLLRNQAKKLWNNLAICLSQFTFSAGLLAEKKN